jgi:tripartite-type tricarboxylate transporter receptor subunit TctC
VPLVESRAMLTARPICKSAAHALLSVCLFNVAGAYAQNFPVRPIRMVIGFTPGGQPDIAARMIAPRLTELLGQQVVVDNRPGAGGVTGSRIVVEAQPDGYTLLASSSSIAISPAVYANMPFDTMRDLSGITTTYSAAYVLSVTPSLPAKTLQDFVALAKAKPGQLNFSSAGNGSGMHFAGEMVKQTLNIDIVHVPYKGVPEAITDTIGGRVQFTMAPLGATIGLIRDGKLRPLAVSSPKRVAVHPDVPAVAELGYPGFRVDSWAGIFAPAKTPRAVINRLNRDIVRVLNEAEIQQRFGALGMEAAPCTPEQLDKFLAGQISQVAQLAKKAGIAAR